MITRGKRGRGAAKKSPPPMKARGRGKGKSRPVAAAAPAKRRGRLPGSKNKHPRKAVARAMAKEIAADIEQKAQRRARVIADVDVDALSAKLREKAPSTTPRKRWVSAKEEAEMEREARENIKKQADRSLEEAYKKVGRKDHSKRSSAQSSEESGDSSTPLSDIEHVKASKLAELDELCKLYRGTMDEIKTLEEMKDALFVNIDELAREMKLGNVHTDEWRLVLARGTSKSLSRTGLLEAGVDLETIEAATVVKGWEKYQIRAGDDFGRRVATGDSE